MVPTPTSLSTKAIHSWVLLRDACKAEGTFTTSLLFYEKLAMSSGFSVFVRNSIPRYLMCKVTNFYSQVLIHVASGFTEYHYGDLIV